MNQGPGAWCCAPARAAKATMTGCGTCAVLICYSREGSIKAMRLLRSPSFTRPSFLTVFVMEAAENRASHVWYATIPYDFKLGAIREANHPLILIYMHCCLTGSDRNRWT
jgi:hypothetical protein